MLLLKLVLTPLLVAATTLVSRRWGPGVGGAMAGLPLTSGPVSVFLALEQGVEFTARAAVGTLLGLLSQASFCLAYAWVAQRAGWGASVAAAVLAFAATTRIVRDVWLPPWSTTLVVSACLVGATLGMPATGRTRLPLPAPRWELAGRMAVATMIVVVLTAAAPRLGPAWTGLLSPFPVFATILGVFTHRSAGAAAAARLLRGIVLGSLAHAAMFVVIAEALPRQSLLSAYALASAAALAVNAFLLSALRRAL